jgi:ABC-type Fe3+/spermidine/putrescine transport system ATPase subunit
LLQLGTPDDIYFRPNCAAVASFIGAANVLQGIAEVVPGRPLSVQFQGGLRLDAADNAAGLANGEAVTIMLRAEQVRVGPPAGGAGLPAQITERLFLGEKVRYELQVPAAGVSLTAITSGDHRRLSLGEDVMVTADPRDVRVLPGVAAPRVSAPRDVAPKADA